MKTRYRKITPPLTTKQKSAIVKLTAYGCPATEIARRIKADYFRVWRFKKSLLTGVEL
jgi:hypothetical protein